MTYQVTIFAEGENQCLPLLSRLQQAAFSAFCPCLLGEARILERLILGADPAFINS